MFYDYNLLELIRPGKDQRDYYYFIALGHYKLEVSGSCMSSETLRCTLYMYFLASSYCTMYALFSRTTLCEIIYVQEYEASQSCVDRVLQMEPNNSQAKQLKQLVSKKIQRGGDIRHACTCSTCILYQEHMSRP